MYLEIRGRSKHSVLPLGLILNGLVSYNVQFSSDWKAYLDVYFITELTTSKLMLFLFLIDECKLHEYISYKIDLGSLVQVALWIFPCPFLLADLSPNLQ